MNFNFMPSLLHMASVKIVSHLLQDSVISKMLDYDIMTLNRFHFFDTRRREKWKLIEKRALELLAFLPATLSDEVAKVIQPMHNEVALWLEDHRLDLYKDIEDYRIDYGMFVWKTEGTINREDTAKKYAHNENIDINERFIIACNYFLFDDVPILWNTMKKSGMNNISERPTNSAVMLWKHFLNENNHKPFNILLEEYLDPSSIIDRDLPLRLSSYFRFLTKDCRKGYLQDSSFGFHKDDLRSCLHQMDEDERQYLFQKIPAFVLQRSLIWPFQNVFINMAKEVSRYMMTTDFRTILHHILVFYIIDGYDYYKDFKAFWAIVPDSSKEEIKADKVMFKFFEVTLNCNGVREGPSSVEAAIEKYYLEKYYFFKQQ